jgi:hypothetical protein
MRFSKWKLTLVQPPLGAMVVVMVIKYLASGRTMIAHLEVSAEEPPCSAVGAAQRNPRLLVNAAPQSFATPYLP